MIKFNNKKESRRVGVVLSLFFMAAVALIGAYYLQWIEPDKNIEMILWIFFLLVAFIYGLGGYCYVEMDISEERFDVKYYNLFVLGRQYKRIVVPMNKVRKIKVRKGLGFLGAGLIVTGRIKGKVAMFPTVGLSACSKEQIKILSDFSKKINEVVNNG